MRWFNLFSRKKEKINPENWLENSYLIIEELIKATDSRDVRTVKKIINSHEYSYFDIGGGEISQGVIDRIDSGEKKYKKILESLEKLSKLKTFELFGDTEESTGGFFGEFREPGTLGILRKKGKKFSDWKKLENELKLAKEYILELIVEEKKLGIKLGQITH
jgi:hypothetical protein